MIPLALVTGFLGSGKTTFLQRIIAQHRDRRLALLVNEFGPVDIDGQLLDVPPDRLVAIPGGSIFCHCLVTDFITHLRTIADLRPAVEGVVIEASGIADPRVVTRLLADTRLDTALRLAMVITIVDPGTFEPLLETLPGIRAQVAAADVAILNKCDLFDEDALAATARRLATLNPRLDVRRAVRCDVPVRLFGSPAPHALEGELAACADPNYGRLHITPADDLDAQTAEAALRSLMNVAYRLKGFLRLGGRLHHVDVSRSGVTLEPAPTARTTPALVCIYPPAALAAVKRVLAQLAHATRTEHKPPRAPC